ncbi:Sec-independent protein translocase subunit TatA [Streptomyces hoynatensis]|uniref:Sec-independent protein translocase protein TatA n=1 Tax=Streptomyces hoynatensis TaxID=1141874 RepID=A0A3A9YQB0_9ACTN|nr:Sec-independent protein translocase subunit TatA [Streptomyces hoynatensis]RKN38173.1 twin-arginine translocase TatA/TatE family subunit [Streptomyces hoynatensis]
MGSLSVWHLLLVFLVVVLVFGSKRLPDTARSLGKSLRILKSETAAMRSESRTETSDAPASDPQAAPRTIQAAPGDTASARPVEEPKGTTAQS